MKTTFKIKGLLVLFAAGLISACHSEKPVQENDGEVITDVTLSFQELDASNNPVGTPFGFTASDPEGIEGGGTPTIETINIVKGKKYRMTVEFYNGVAMEDITEEVQEESDAHQLFFLGTAFDSNILSIQYADAGGIDLGLVNLLTVSSSPGTNNTSIRIVLRHDLDKNYPGASNPNFANFVQAGGETDLDLTFPVVIN